MKIAIIGDGGWGTAIAIMLSEKGNDVFLWSNFPDYAGHLDKTRDNTKFLPGIRIPDAVKITSDINLAVNGAELIVLAVPSKYMRDVCKKIKIVKAKCLLSVAKGIEVGTLKRMSEVIKEEIPGFPVAVLSGPSHAEEVSRKLPTAVSVAAENLETADFVQKVFMGDRFRVYTTTDVIGVELGGALKNVIAIAVGICDGAGMGDSAKSALMTRGIAEMTRLGVAMGSKKETFAGLAGIGDLIVTCISKYGRNLRFGRMLAEGKTPDEVAASTEMVAEGVTTSDAVHELSGKYDIEMPIANEVYLGVYKNKPIRQAIQDLMKRSPKKENEW